jgi:hypothetical protein
MSDELKPLVGSVAPNLEPVEHAVEEVVVVEEAEPEEIKSVPAQPAPKPQVSKFAEPVAVDINAVIDSLPAPAGPAVVGLGEVDDVLLSSCIYKNKYARKSLTVHHLQRRLSELGYTQAGLDKDGYYGDLTKAAVLEFQLANNLSDSGMVDAVTFELIFKGDPNVKVVL